MMLSTFFFLFFAIATTMSQLLVLSISLSALVAFADFLPCVFLWDGRIALCDSLKRTKTFSAWRVCGHTATAPGGAWRWWRGGQTWHATHTLWPCRTGNNVSGNSILRECFFSCGRFYGLIIEYINCLNVPHSQNTADDNHTNTGKHKWEEKVRYQTVQMDTTKNHKIIANTYSMHLWQPIGSQSERRW